MLKIAAPISCLWLSSFAFVMCLGVAGCITPPAPYEEYVIARAAVKSAQEVDSARFAGGLWYQAEDNFRKGQAAFKDAEYQQAKRFFKAATHFAERAENATRLKKFQTGDSFP